MSTSLAREVRHRLLPAFVLILIVWPAFSILCGATILGEQAFTGIVPWSGRMTGETAAAAYLLPEILVCALLLSGMSIVGWTLLDRIAGGTTRGVEGWAEPVIFLFSLGTGVAIDHPSLLRHPLLVPLRSLPVLMVLSLLFLLCIGSGVWIGFLRTRRSGRASIYGLGLASVACLTAVVVSIPVRHRGEGLRESILLLGIDSLASTQDVAQLEKMCSGPGWTWYRHAVTPGLLTNSVWPSILMNRFPHETGCFLTFQEPNWTRSPYNMVESAERAGMDTWSFFSDQFTTYVGSDGGFTVDRSGPRGWLQPATAAFKDGSVLMPVILSRLPKIPGARSPANQSGTFAYDLRRELDEILTAGDGRGSLFVAAHSDYLHQPAYPALHELTRAEALSVLRAPAGAIRDQSLHWQYPALPDEPLGIYSWKLQRLQREIRDSFADHQILEPRRRNRIVIFADHGPRGGLVPGDFSSRHLYKVVFATYGTESRDPSYPISLLEIDALIGLTDPTRPGRDPAAVEYTHVRNAREGMILAGSSSLRPDGTVVLDRTVLRLIGRELLAYFPHQASRGYIPVPTEPGEVSGSE